MTYPNQSFRFLIMFSRHRGCDIHRYFRIFSLVYDVIIVSGCIFHSIVSVSVFVNLLNPWIDFGWIRRRSEVSLQTRRKNLSFYLILYFYYLFILVLFFCSRNIIYPAGCFSLALNPSARNVLPTLIGDG